MKARSCFVLLLLMAGCAADRPRRVENANLGIAAVFPGEPRLNKREEDTPFGRMEWFDTVFVNTRRLDESFHISVGNLPKGSKGGVTPGQVLATFQKWLDSQLGPVRRTTMPADRGPGFHYSRSLPTRWTEGIVVVRQGRLHHAQASVKNPADPRVKTFLEGFEVK
jgi:hypothetical protein